MKEIKIYKTLSDKEPYLDWYLSLDNSQKIIISKRLQRVKINNYGDYKDLGEGLKEFRFKTGIRIYFI
jgi:putative addiction module killer protein